MPRGPRLDAPDALHHVIARGIERRAIVEHDGDRQDFLERLARGVERAHTGLFAWCLMPNHFHLLLRTGRAPLSTVMRRVLTGYAVAFNRRHRRAGHLFQNRFKSILVEPLGSGCGPALPDGIGYPLGSTESFRHRATTT
jgi:putative transposase